MKGLDLLIHKDPNDFRPQRIRPILLFDVEAILHNKTLRKEVMQLAILTGTLSPEQYGSIKSKVNDAQALNTRLFCDLTRIKRVSATSVFAELFSNYDLVTHNIAALSLQRANVSKEPIIYTFTTLQEMVHSVRTAFRDSDTLYEGNK